MKKLSHVLLKPPVLFSILISLGFLLRLYLSSLAYRPLVFDMRSYHEQALQFLDGKLINDCCGRNVGFSVVLAGIYAIVGEGNRDGVTLVNILLDLSVAILLYLIAKKYFTYSVAILGLGMYALNPLTSSFTGLIFSESITLFLITFISFLLLKHNIKNNVWYWLGIGLLLGILLFIRHSTLYFVLLLVVLLPLSGATKKIKIGALIFCLVGFIVGSSYTLYGNYTAYKKVTLVPPYPWVKGFRYMMFFYDKYPEVSGHTQLPPIFAQMAADFDQEPIPKTEFNQKYGRLLSEKIQSDRLAYLRILFRNFIHLWDKSFLFTYIDPYYPGDLWPIRIGNIVLIFFFLIGFVKSMLKKWRIIFRDQFLLYVIILFGYVAAGFPFISNESRHTLIFYPFLMLWAAYGMIESTNLLMKKSAN